MTKIHHVGMYSESTFPGDCFVLNYCNQIEYSVQEIDQFIKRKRVRFLHGKRYVGLCCAWLVVVQGTQNSFKEWPWHWLHFFEKVLWISWNHKAKEQLNKEFERFDGSLNLFRLLHHTPVEPFTEHRFICHLFAVSVDTEAPIPHAVRRVRPTSAAYQRY